MSKATVPRRSASLPIRLLAVEVTEGPDAGARAVAAGESLTVGSAQDNDLVLTDAAVSRYHVELAAHEEGVLLVDHGSTNGTWMDDVRLDRAVVPAKTVLAIGDTRLRVLEGGSRALELHEDDKLHELRGKTPALRRLMAQITRAARTDASVLILGESGTGKELVARTLHESSPRAAGPLVTVDCGALSPTLVASELFGHERGAFTGATKQHIGACERASGGTLFLDEIGELPLPLQANLLGVLERKRLRRVGGDQEIGVDIRVVSATHHDLRADVNSDGFRLDLFYRLAVVILNVPPLREHTADIPGLIQHFLQGAELDDTLFGPETLEQLCGYAWPGNVRELRNYVEATVAMGEGAILHHDLAGHLEASDNEDTIEGVLSLGFKEARATVVAEFERRYLTKLLESSGGNVSQAARQAGVDRSYLNGLLQRHGLR